MPLENQTGTYKYYLGITFAFPLIIVMLRICIDFGRLNPDPSPEGEKLLTKIVKKLGIKNCNFWQRKGFFHL